MIFMDCCFLPFGLILWSSMICFEFSLLYHVIISGSISEMHYHLIFTSGKCLFSYFFYFPFALNCCVIKFWKISKQPSLNTRIIYQMLLHTVDCISHWSPMVLFDQIFNLISSPGFFFFSFVVNAFCHVWKFTKTMKSHSSFILKTP